MGTAGRCAQALRWDEALTGGLSEALRGRKERDSEYM
jgi:hypothetical protein